MSKDRKNRKMAKETPLSPEAGGSAKAAETPQMEIVRQDSRESLEKAAVRSHTVLAGMLEGRYGSRSDSGGAAQKTCTRGYAPRTGGHFCRTAKVTKNVLKPTV